MNKKIATMPVNEKLKFLEALEKISSNNCKTKKTTTNLEYILGNYSDRQIDNISLCHMVYKIKNQETCRTSLCGNCEFKKTSSILKFLGKSIDMAKIDDPVKRNDWKK